MFWTSKTFLPYPRYHKQLNLFTDYAALEKERKGEKNGFPKPYSTRIPPSTLMPCLVKSSSSSAISLYNVEPNQAA